MNTPKVDFYLLKQHQPDGLLRLTCRLVQKIYRLGEQMYVLARDEEQACRIDDLLWTFDQGSFVPHHREGQPQQARSSPIAIGHLPPGNAGGNVLISLQDSAPACFSDFARVADLVDDLEDEKAKARERFRYYRDRGCMLDTHMIGL